MSGNASFFSPPSQLGKVILFLPPAGRLNCSSSPTGRLNCSSPRRGNPIVPPPGGATQLFLPPSGGEVRRGGEGKAIALSLVACFSCGLSPHPNPPPAGGRELRFGPLGERNYCSGLMIGRQNSIIPPPSGATQLFLPPSGGEVRRGGEGKAIALSLIACFGCGLSPHPNPPPAGGRELRFSPLEGGNRESPGGGK